MENKKIMIPIVLGVILLCGIIFTVVYKKTDGNVRKDQPVIQTLAPKETKEVETKVVGESSGSLEDFEINEEIREKTLDELGGSVVIAVGDIERSNTNSNVSSSDNANQEFNNETIDEFTNENTSESNTISETLSNEEIESIRSEYLDWQITVQKEDESYEEIFTPEERESIAAETVGDISMYYLPK